MTDQILKCDVAFWLAAARGDKTFEVCRDDRHFQRGDVLIMLPYNRESQAYEPIGGSIQADVSYVLRGGQFGIEAGYVILGMRNVKWRHSNNSEWATAGEAS